MNKPRQAAPAQATVRCAIYTRKSTEEGLQMEFNTLDAQRECAEAYIRSQTGEGWVCLGPVILTLKLKDQRHECFGDISPAELAEVAMLVRLIAV